MTDLLVNELKVLRDTCRKVGVEHGLSGAGGIEDVVTKLNLMIVEATQGQQLQTDRKAGIADSGYAGIDTATETFPAIGTGSAGALKADYAYWKALEQACREQSDVPEAAADAAASTTPEGERPAQLTAFLRESISGEPDVTVADMSVMTAGYSKKTYRARLEGNRTLPDTLVVRADQAGHYVKTTVLNEFALLQLLEKHGVPVPHAYAIDRSGGYFGAPFMVLDIVNGKTVGDPFTAPPSNDDLVRSTASAMAFYHAIPLDALETAGIQHDPAKPHIDAEFAQYLETWKSVRQYCPTLDVAFEWIADNMAAAYGRNTLVHNDFNYNNMLVDQNRVMSVLDWEFAHVGNPAADLGYHKYAADRMAGFDFFKDCYAEAGGILPSDAEIDFYYIWGMTRLGVMILQAQALFDEGQNLDLRFAVAGAKYLRPTLMAIGEHLGKILKTT